MIHAVLSDNYRCAVCGAHVATAREVAMCDPGTLHPVDYMARKHAKVCPVALAHERGKP